MSALNVNIDNRARFEGNGPETYSVRDLWVRVSYFLYMECVSLYSHINKTIPLSCLWT